MFNVLKDFCKQGKNASIYTNMHDTNKFYYGRILAVNENEVLVYMFSKNGIFDGIMLKPISAVFRIEIDGQYETKMQKLISYSSPVPFDEELNPLNLKDSLLQIALKTQKIVSIELLNSGYNDIVGFVKEIQGDFCKIQVVDEYGLEDGQSFIDSADITQIHYASEDEDRILRLYKCNY